MKKLSNSKWGEKELSIFKVYMERYYKDMHRFRRAAMYGDHDRTFAKDAVIFNEEEQIRSKLPRNLELQDEQVC